MNSQLITVVRAWIPNTVRYWVQRYVSLTAIKLRWRADIASHPMVFSSDKNDLGIPFRFGIVKNSTQAHGSYVTGCQEMGVPFTVIDLAASDWLDQVRPKIRLRAF